MDPGGSAVPPGARSCRSQAKTVRLKEPRGGDWPPPELHLADDVFLRHHAPVTAVGAVVPMIAHDEVVALGDHLRPPFVVAAILGGHVVVMERNVVHVDTPVYDSDGIAFFGNDSLHE